MLRSGYGIAVQGDILGHAVVDEGTAGGGPRKHSCKGTNYGVTARSVATKQFRIYDEMAALPLMARGHRSLAMTA
jgi:hypothetical protein